MELTEGNGEPGAKPDKKAAGSDALNARVDHMDEQY
jgi:hypothetical protein